MILFHNFFVSLKIVDESKKKFETAYTCILCRPFILITYKKIILLYLENLYFIIASSSKINWGMHFIKLFGLS